MKSESFLIGVAQIGMVFTGVTGIVAMFRHTDQGWLAREILAVRFILEHSFAVVFFALLPILFSYMCITEPTILRMVSLPLSCFFVFQIYITDYRTKRVPSRKPRLLLYTFLYPALFFFEVELLNTIWWGSLPVFIFGLLWLLIPPGVQFYLFVLFLRSPTNRANYLHDNT